MAKFSLKIWCPQCKFATPFQLLALKFYVHLLIMTAPVIFNPIENLTEENVVFKLKGTSLQKIAIGHMYLTYQNCPKILIYNKYFSCSKIKETLMLFLSYSKLFMVENWIIIKEVMQILLRLSRFWAPFSLTIVQFANVECTQITDPANSLIYIPRKSSIVYRT